VSSLQDLIFDPDFNLSRDFIPRFDVPSLQDFLKTQIGT
jgi:hypothetical protein